MLERKAAGQIHLGRGSVEVLKVVGWPIWKDRWCNYHLKMYIIYQWRFGEWSVLMNSLGLFSYFQKLTACKFLVFQASTRSAVYWTNKTHTLAAGRRARWRTPSRPRILWNPVDLCVLLTLTSVFHNMANPACPPVTEVEVVWSSTGVHTLVSRMGSSREDLLWLLVILFLTKWTHSYSSAKKWPPVF